MEQGTRDVRLTQGFWQLGDIATVAHMPVVVVHDEGDSQAAVGGGHGKSSSAATVWRRANWSWYSLWPASPSSARRSGRSRRSRASRASWPGSPAGAKATAPSAQTGSERTPMVVATGTPLARAAISEPRRLLAPSG